MSAAKGYRVMGAQTWEDVKGEVGAFLLAFGVVLLAGAAAFLAW